MTAAGRAGGWCSGLRVGVLGFGSPRISAKEGLRVSHLVEREAGGWICLAYTAKHPQGVGGGAGVGERTPPGSPWHCLCPALSPVCTLVSLDGSSVGCVFVGEGVCSTA